MIAETLAVALPVLGGVVWFVRLEGRVNGHDSLFGERKAQEVVQYETLIREIGSLRELVLGLYARQDSQNPSRPPLR